MPIRVEHGPASLVGTLAIQAGEASAYQRAASRSVQQQALGLQAIAARRREAAGDRAFELQQAMAEREVTRAQKTPLATRVSMQAMARQVEQGQLNQQLKSMQESDMITAEQAAKARAAYLAGDKSAVGDILTPKPPKRDTLAIDLISQPFDSKRRLLENQVRELQKNLLDPMTKAIGDPAAIQAQLDSSMAKLEQLHIDKTTTIEQYRARQAGTLAADTGFSDQLGGDPLEGRVIINPDTGQRRIRRNGRWVPLQ